MCLQFGGDFFSNIKGYFTDQRLPTNVNLYSLANLCFQTLPWEYIFLGCLPVIYAKIKIIFTSNAPRTIPENVFYRMLIILNLTGTLWKKEDFNGQVGLENTGLNNVKCFFTYKYSKNLEYAHGHHQPPIG